MARGDIKKKSDRQELGTPPHLIPKMRDPPPPNSENERPPPTPNLVFFLGVGVDWLEVVLGVRSRGRPSATRNLHFSAGLGVRGIP